MSDFEPSAVNLGTLFYSREQLDSSPTAGFHRAAYGGLLDHRFNRLAGDTGFRVELDALANLGRMTPAPAARPDTPQNS